MATYNVQFAIGGHPSGGNFRSEREANNHARKVSRRAACCLRVVKHDEGKSLFVASWLNGKKW